ncbi:MAG: hypothetical protein IKO68_03680 [Oscillospiraceae bacterium]|nr:hypothetical protein [Oscillospiraceae bacterium]
MKALVLEKRDGLAAVLREDGVYATTAQPCEVGETIELDEKIIPFPRQKKRWVKTGIAAVLALCIFSGSYSYLSVSASDYVSLDVGETSVEVTVNHLGRVISARALNESSRDMAQALNASMRGKKVEEALTEAVDEFRRGGLFEEPDSFLIAGVVSPSERRGERISETLERATLGPGDENPEVYAFRVSREERREAEQKDMSPGRFAFEQNGGERPDAPPDLPNPNVIEEDFAPAQDGEMPLLPLEFRENPPPAEEAEPIRGTEPPAASEQEVPPPPDGGMPPDISDRSTGEVPIESEATPAEDMPEPAFSETLPDLLREIDPVELPAEFRPQPEEIAPGAVRADLPEEKLGDGELPEPHREEEPAIPIEQREEDALPGYDEPPYGGIRNTSGREELPPESLPSEPDSLPEDRLPDWPGEPLGDEYSERTEAERPKAPAEAQPSSMNAPPQPGEGEPFAPSAGERGGPMPQTGPLPEN